MHKNILSFNLLKSVYRLLVGKPEGKRPLGRPRRRWIDNIKIELLEIGLSVVDWFDLAQERYSWRALVNAVMNLRVPLNAGKLQSGRTTCGLSSGTQIHSVSELSLKVSTVRCLVTVSSCLQLLNTYTSEIQKHSDRTFRKYLHFVITEF
jgi:hypothetical protein